MLPGNYIFKVNNKNTRTRCEICSKLTIKIPEQTYLTPSSGVSIVNFEHVIAGWVCTSSREHSHRNLDQKC